MCCLLKICSNLLTGLSLTNTIFLRLLLVLRCLRWSITSCPLHLFFQIATSFFGIYLSIILISTSFFPFPLLSYSLSFENFTIMEKLDIHRSRQRVWQFPCTHYPAPKINPALYPYPKQPWNKSQVSCNCIYTYFNISLLKMNSFLKHITIILYSPLKKAITP